MVGDGITDLEAVQETGAADLFIGYGGVVVRPFFQPSVANADLKCPVGDSFSRSSLNSALGDSVVVVLDVALSTRSTACNVARTFPCERIAAAS